MSILTIGKIRPTYKGEWSADAAYETLDWVLYRGLAWQALKDVPVNREPDVAPDYWVQTGMKGDKGDRGDAGERGPAGVDGRDGAEGVQGPAGLQGQQGIQGVKGDAGAIGPQGPVGPAPEHQWAGTKLSVKNPDGAWGAAVDLRGPQGVMGPEGPAGAQGIQGPVGPQGPTGPQGVKGATGATPALNNTVTSTSTTEAATANAVKLAYDKAVAAAVAGHKHAVADITGVLPVANGGTGLTTLQAVRNAMGLGNTTGVLPVANGGTGNTTNTSANSTKWNGAAKTVSAAGPSGGADGDIWLQYI